jgi:hypothetical protein
MGRVMVTEAEGGRGRRLGKEEVWVKVSDRRHHM